jgi:hypothetical protein
MDRFYLILLAPHALKQFEFIAMEEILLMFNTKPA